MNSGTDLPVVGSALELLQLAKLSDIVFYSVSATRKEDSGATETSQQFAVFVFHDDDRIEVRCRARVETPEAEYVVDASSRFTLSHPVDITESAKQEFVEKVGLMAVYPYVRESVAAGAAKLRLGQPLLQLLRIGDVSLTATPSE